MDNNEAGGKVMLSSVQHFSLEVRRACLQFDLIMPTPATDTEWTLLHLAFAEPGTNLVRGMRNFFENERTVESPYFGRPMSRLDARLGRSLIEDIRRLPYVWTACQDFHLDLQRKGADRYLSKSNACEPPTASLDSLLELHRSVSKFCEPGLPVCPSLTSMIADTIRARQNIFSVTESDLFSFHRALRQFDHAVSPELQRTFFDLAETLTLVPLALLLQIEESMSKSTDISEALETLQMSSHDSHSRLIEAVRLFSTLMLRGSYLRTSPLIALANSANDVDSFDVIQEALLGAIIGAERFDYRTDTRALEPCTTWAWQRVQRYSANHARTVRVPIHYQVQRSRNLKENANRFPRLRLTTALPLDSVLHVTGTTEDEESYIPFGELCEEAQVAFCDIPFVLSRPHMDLNNAQILEDLFGALSDKERWVIELRFGLSKYLPKTLDEIGGLLGVTRERIRQIEKKALTKLTRRAKANRGANDYWGQDPQYFPVNYDGLAQSLVSLLRTHRTIPTEGMRKKVARDTAMLKRAFLSLPSWRGHGGRRGSASRLERVADVVRSFAAPAHYSKIHAALCAKFPEYERSEVNTCACLYKHKDLFARHGNGCFSLATKNIRPFYEQPVSGMAPGDQLLLAME